MGIMEIVLPVAVCFIVTAIAGKLLIPALVKLKAGQSIKEIGPSWHMTKQGTPTMGVLGWQRMMAGSFVTCMCTCSRWYSALSDISTTIRR